MADGIFGIDHIKRQGSLYEQGVLVLIFTYKE